jgi:AcrR family transcriptional regulator
MDEAEERDRSARVVVNSRGKGLKQERALRTRAHILAEAAKAFALHGFNAVTIQGVADLAGMTAGAVYFHFANKQHLAYAVTEEFYTRWPALAGEVAKLDLSPADALIEFLRRTALAFQNDTVVQAGARLQIERLDAQFDLPAPFDVYGRLLSDFVGRAYDSGEFDTGIGQASLVRVLLSAMFGTQHISWVRSDRADMRERTEEVIQALIDPIRRPGTAG